MKYQLKDYLTWLFNAFEKEGIAFCILRNYESLPEQNTGKDIDMLVGEKDVKNVERVLGRLAVRFDLKLQTVIKKHRYMLCKSTTDDMFFLPIDIHTDEESYGFIYLTGKDILGRRKRCRNFFVPHPIDEAIVSWFASYLSGGFIKKNYTSKILTILAQDVEGFDSSLRQIIGNELSEQTLSLLKTKGLESTLRLRRKIFLSIILRTLTKRPIKQLKNTILFVEGQLRIRFNPKGIMTAIIGTDGSGKSTIASKVSENIPSIFHLESGYIIHLRPGFLPPLRNIFQPWKWRGKNDVDVIVTNPHASEPSGSFFSCVRLLYYFLDFTLGYYLATRKFLVRGRLVFFDRYYYDFLFDQYRSRIDLPIWVIRLFLPFVPKPDIILCLGADPEIIHARKPELPLEEFKRQIDALRQFCDKNKRAVWIDTGCSIEESVNQAIEAIATRIATRYE